MKIEELQKESIIHLKDKLQESIDNIKQVIEIYNRENKLLEKFTKTYRVVMHLKIVQQYLEDYVITINKDINELETKLD